MGVPRDGSGQRLRLEMKLERCRVGLCGIIAQKLGGSCHEHESKQEEARHPNAERWRLRKDRHQDQTLEQQHV